VFRGHISVQRRLPPVAIGRYVNEKCLLVEFNEPVQAEALRVRLDCGATVEQARLDDNGRRLVIRLAEPLRHNDALHLVGIRDRAQVPNALADKPIPVTVPSWPTNRTGLVFLWDNAHALNSVTDSRTGEVHELRVGRDEGAAGVDRYGRMRLEGGRLSTGFFSKTNADLSQFRDVVAANAFSLEATIQPADLDQNKPVFPARIINCSTRHDGDWEFLLGQQRDRLVFSVRTSANMLSLEGEPVTRAPFGRAPLYDIARLPDTGPHHVIVSYVPGRLAVYLDGSKTFEATDVTGTLKAWGLGELCFGDNHNGGRHAWLGTIEGVAIYARFIEAEEAGKNYMAMRTRVTSRKPLPQIEVDAKLLAVSRIPELREIAPYRDALVVNEFAVTKVRKVSKDWKINGAIEGGRKIRVAQWGMVDGTKTALAQAKVGETYRLVLEVFTGHPEKVEEREIANSLAEDFEVPVLYEPRP
jgi:hypothetical protein